METMKKEKNELNIQIKRVMDNLLQKYEEELQTKLIIKLIIINMHFT